MSVRCLFGRHDRFRALYGGFGEWNGHPAIAFELWLCRRCPWHRRTEKPL